MPVYRNERKFGGVIKISTEYEKYPEMCNLLKEHICDDEFYNLCKSFIDISLNAPQFPDKDKLKVEACFQYSDMDKAKEITQNFINTFNILNIEESLAVIKMFYPYASNNYRPNAGTLFKNAPYNSPNVRIY